MSCGRNLRLIQMTKNAAQNNNLQNNDINKARDVYIVTSHSSVKIPVMYLYIIYAAVEWTMVPD